MLLLGIIKRNPLFLHEIEWKNNGFLFITPNIFRLFKFIKFLCICICIFNMYLILIYRAY